MIAAWTRMVVVEEIGEHLSGERILEATGIWTVIALTCSPNNLLLIWLDLPVWYPHLGFQEVFIGQRNVSMLVKLDGASVQAV